MPWKEQSTMSLRREVVEQMLQEGTNVSALCRRYGICRKTAYKWLRRYREGGWEALQDLPRRPRESPHQTPQEVEDAVLAVRQAHPAWGARKIHAFLRRGGQTSLPSPSTIQRILQRRGCIAPQAVRNPQPPQRFQRDEPNQLWQMDFKSPLRLPEGTVCYPLTVLDDHSRFLLALQACPNQQMETVQAILSRLFRQYGLPQAILVDNGSPWGDYQQGRRYTALEAWLIRLGVQVLHSRPYHPQTLGKDERLHRTLGEEVLRQQPLETLAQCQEAFDQWREVYNAQRPHEAIGMQVPAEVYRPSPRPLPEVLPPLLYPPEAAVRKVDAHGRISFQGQVFRVGKAFRRQEVALFPLAQKGQVEVYFCAQHIKTLSLAPKPVGRDPSSLCGGRPCARMESVTHVPEQL
ncbi:MAG: IS481 family transposase [Anaerolineae bacterium]|nr:IS481 family transposase [Anaerolineae bacterium]